jgi:hypothetical protein
MKTETTEKFEKDWHFANPDDTIMGIETAIYKNGNQVKRFTLSDGRVAVIRELLGKDSMQIDKSVMGENNADLREEKAMHAMFHFAVKVDDKQIPIEDFGTMKMRDYNKIKLAVQSLNF